MSSELIDTLTAYIALQSGASPYVTAIPGVTILHADAPRSPMPLLHKPALCLVAQGRKRGVFGETHLEYHPGQALVVGIETPSIGWVSHASVSEPFLGMVIEFNIAVMREVLADIGGLPERESAPAVFVAAVEAPVTDCATRLVRLLERPDAIGAISPLIMRELSYWLLTAPYGPDIAAMIADGDRARGIIAALHQLRTRFAAPIRIDELAAAAQMSVSTFHRQFKIITSMTPIQYQKQLRLLEARNLMIGQGANAETAAFRVGYESSSHFSREYARMFGAPPRRDAVALRH